MTVEFPGVKWEAEGMIIDRTGAMTWERMTKFMVKRWVADAESYGSHEYHPQGLGTGSLLRWLSADGYGKCIEGAMTQLYCACLSQWPKTKQREHMTVGKSGADWWRLDRRKLRKTARGWLNGREAGMIYWRGWGGLGEEDVGRGHVEWSPVTWAGKSYPSAVGYDRYELAPRAAKEAKKWMPKIKLDDEVPWRQLPRFVLVMDKESGQGRSWSMPSAPPDLKARIVAAQKAGDEDRIHILTLARQVAKPAVEQLLAKKLRVPANLLEEARR